MTRYNNHQVSVLSWSERNRLVGLHASCLDKDNVCPADETSFSAEDLQGLVGFFVVFNQLLGILLQKNVQR